MSVLVSATGLALIDPRLLTAQCATPHWRARLRALGTKRALELASLGLARLRCGVATGGVAGNLAGYST